MTKTNFVFDHIRDPAFRDSRRADGLWLPQSNRLHFIAEKMDGGWERIATEVNKRADAPFIWFPDANVAILDDTEPVWTAFRLASLRSKREVAILSAPAFEELKEWINDPYRNHKRAATLRAALKEQQSWAGLFSLDPNHDPPIFGSLYSYIRLLGLRRRLALPLADGSSPVGAPTDSLSDAMNAIKDRIGVRGQTLARKGRQDHERRGAINLNDESHIIHAIAYAIGTRTETAVLTTDYDCLEIFYKAQWFFDTHYRAWLAADWIAQGRLGKPVRNEMAPTFFDGPVMLYQRPSLNMSEVLPVLHTTIPVHVLYVAPNEEIWRFMFAFERGMVGMLRTRGETAGRCTDRLGDANIHIDVAPLGMGFGKFVGVGKDVTSLIEETSMALSYMDVIHAINCQERFQLIESHSPD